ncbi:MAG: single-stranded-DNA-specific exonuclease RecJ [Verrucomicrobiales bacterium]|jgi:single-stranded-DNA-specific exonuclease|nr:single-stranded-DNA-specific exonuclease RecJ [Verrucomicrobiales bacterium]
MLAKVKWVLHPPPDPELVRRYASSMGLAPVVVSLALQRGYHEREALERFLYPRLSDLRDPFSLPGVAAAVERILQAVDEKQSVVLYGDYDVDGVSSITLLYAVLSAFGLEPRTFLPTRLEEGYGLSVKGIVNSLDGDPPDLLIAADCGTNSRAEAEMLQEMGIDLIILDHHEPAVEGTAVCAALVNPKLGDEFHYLCTAGVVFKIAHALMKTRPLTNFDLKSYLDIVALGTIADIVPLEGENRLFARRGLTQLDRTIHPGLIALKSVAGVSSPARTHDVGFKIGPRLNASGRLDTALASLRLLLCQDPAEARILAESLDQQNRDRQELELATREEAEQMIRNLPADHLSHAIVVGARGWHPGVVGIVASRISKQYHRPAFIIGIDENGLGKGSGRSIPGVSLVQGLDSCRDLIESGGGHEMAAGVSVREENLDAFREAMIRNVRDQVDGDTLIPKLYLDAEIRFPELTLDLLDSYELLRPFGQANPQPLFLSTRVQVLGEPRIIKEKHLKFRFAQDGVEHEGIYFNGAEAPLPDQPWDIAFTIDRNEFRGRVKVNMVISAIRRSS